MFLDHLNTKGYNKMSAAMIEMKDVFISNFRKTYAITKEAIPMATFNP